MALGINGRVFALFVIIAMLLPLRLPGQTRATRQRTDTAAAIRVARATFQESERAIASHRWVRSDTTVRCGDEDPGMDVILNLDSAGVVRHLEWSGGTDDHAATHRYFYDAKARLRFAFTTLGSVNGTQQEERVYYGDRGEVVRRLTRLVRGPGYPIEAEGGVPDPTAWLRAICK